VTKAATYSTHETLRDGRVVTIRALRPDDRSGMLSAFGRVSAQSLYRRFFGPKRGLTEKETDYFVNVDFVMHVALVAVIDEGGQATIIGAGRYIVVEPGKAEVAFAIIDQYQGHGIGTALLRNLVSIARESGLQQLVAEVLPENAPMLALFRKWGFGVSKSVARVVHVVLDLNGSNTPSS
jgi:RimJ/RimL family protein N-acetyltransferase